MEKSKLPKAFKKKWVAALRSGKYKQGAFSLKYGTGKNARYCCLGVACVVAGHRLRIEAGMIDEERFPKVPKLLRGSGALPSILANLNDKGVPFSQIADKIEKDL